MQVQAARCEMPWLTACALRSFWSTDEVRGVGRSAILGSAEMAGHVGKGGEGVRGRVLALLISRTHRNVASGLRAAASADEPASPAAARTCSSGWFAYTYISLVYKLYIILYKLYIIHIHYYTYRYTYDYQLKCKMHICMCV